MESNGRGFGAMASDSPAQRTKYGSLPCRRESGLDSIAESANQTRHNSMPSFPPALSKLKRWYCSTPLSPDHHQALSLLLQGPVPPHHLPQIHAGIFRAGAHQDNLIATRLIGRYTPHLAPRILALLHRPNIFPFNAAIRVLSEAGLFSPAFSLFKSLKLRSLSPNDFTFSFLLKACCLRSVDAHHIRQIHTHVIKSGFDLDPFVSNGLLTVYAKGIRDIASARNLFDEMPDKKRTVGSWTCLITAYAQSGRSEEALMLFLRMAGENLKPEDDTMVGALSACSKIEIGEIERWVDIFLECRAADLDDLLHDSIDTVLIYLYGKWGKVEKSEVLFNNMMERGRVSSSIVTWNTMIGGYVQNGQPVEAVNLFHQLISSNSLPKPNHVTFVSLLSACSLVGDLNLGRWVHEYVKTKGPKGAVESNKILATAFIDMYSKCGSLKEAKGVFDRIANRDVVSFNAMIMGLAMNCHGEEALRLFSEMDKFGIQPNDRTFLGLLCACNHSGLVAQGRIFFRDMHHQYLITPKLEHYACFVDLLG